MTEHQRVGLDIGVISPALFSMMVMMALITTFTTTPALSVIYPRQMLGAAADRLQEHVPPPTRMQNGEDAVA